MKRYKILSLITISILMVSIIFSAVPFTVIATTNDDTFGYIINSDNTIKITSYSGTTKNLTIPDEINGYKVTSIGESAFSRCYSLNTIIIPNSVTHIGNWAFRYCTNLSNISLSDNIVSLGTLVFDNTNWYDNQPDGLVYIGNVLYTYKGNMQKNASIIIKEGTTCIADRAFAYYFTNLSEISIPSSVKYIGGYAFCECKNLKNITIPEGVLSIGYNAFGTCTNLKTINIPSSITNISETCFSLCWNLESINVNHSNAYYCSVEGVLFNKTKTDLITYPINKPGDEYIVPNNVVNIRKLAFRDSKLIDITIPDSVTSIGDFAFSDCITLKNINGANYVKYMGYKVFENTSWYNNQPNGLIYIGRTLYEYKGNMSTKKSITIKEGTLCIADHAFFNCHNLQSIKIPDSVVRIGDYAFMDCSGIINLQLPKNLLSIGDFAFFECESLTNIIIPDKVTSIGFQAFLGCTSLSNVILPISLTHIGDEAFFNCNNLTSIIIPKNTKNIGKYSIGYYLDLNTATYKKLENFTIYGYLYTEAEIYAISNGFNFIDLLKNPYYILGDANGDGHISILDATSIQKHLAGLIELVDNQKLASDVNNDGIINVLDATAIQKYLTNPTTFNQSY